MVNIFEKFYKLCNERRSVHTFGNRHIEDEMIKNIINLVQTAPSAGNLQEYKIYVIKNKDKINQLAKASNNQSFISDAPLILGFIATPNESEEEFDPKDVIRYSIQDATVACTYAMLAVATLDLSSTWVGISDEIRVKEILEINEDGIPVALLPIGYSNFNPLHPSRKKNSEIVQII